MDGRRCPGRATAGDRNALCRPVPQLHEHRDRLSANQHDAAAVHRSARPPGPQPRRRQTRDRPPLRRSGCGVPDLSGTATGIARLPAYCPYTRAPDSRNIWTAPDFARAQRLVAASGTQRARVTVWGWTETTTMSPDISRHTAAVLRRLGYRATARLISHSAFDRLPPSVLQSAQIIPTAWPTRARTTSSPSGSLAAGPETTAISASPALTARCGRHRRSRRRIHAPPPPVDRDRPRDRRPGGMGAARQSTGVRVRLRASATISITPCGASSPVRSR